MKTNIETDSPPFASCSQTRILNIKQFIEILTVNCGVRVVKQTQQYCRLYFGQSNPRWIRLYPYPSRESFVAAFFVEQNRLQEFLIAAQKLGLDAEEGKQVKNSRTDRARIQIPDGFNHSNDAWLELLIRLKKSYQRI